MKVKTIIFLFMIFVHGKFHSPANEKNARPISHGQKPMHFFDDLKNNFLAGKYGPLTDLLIKKGDSVLLSITTGKERLAPVESVSKSVTALVVGAAIKNGHIKSVEEKVLNYYPQYRKKAQNGWEDVTIRDLLTMRSGIEWNEDLRPEYSNPVYKMYKAKDIFQFIFSMRISEKKEFNYCSANAALLSGIIQKATGQSFAEYAGKNIFSPLGITKYYFSRYLNQFDNSSGGLYLKTADMLKIGELCLQKGKWKGSHVVPETWMDSTFTLSSSATGYHDANGYGYLWWIRSCQENNQQRLSAYSANGYNNNHIIIIPGARMVIVIRGGSNSNAHRYCLLAEEILASIHITDSIPDKHQVCN